MSSVRIIGIANDVPVGETVRRTLKVPFGEYLDPEQDNVLQIVNAATSGKIVAGIRTALAKGKRGLPIYNGHPDGENSIPSDPAEYGLAVDASVEADCLSICCELTPEGIGLVRSGRNKFSPHWLAMLRNNKAFPFEMLSIGLTDRPKIPVAAIANQRTSATSGQRGVPMRDKLIAALKKLGTEIPADATDEVVLGAVESGLGKVTTLINELGAEKAKVTNLEGTVATLTNERDAEKAKVADGVAAIANERKLRTGILVDAGLADGRIAPAARQRWEGDFANDFDGTVVKLANAQPAFKVIPIVNDLARRNAETVNGSEQRRAQQDQLISQIQRENGLSTRAEAFELALRRNPAVFA